MGKVQGPGSVPEAEAELRLEVMRWAEDKGHIPQKKLVRFRGEAIHSAPHYLVVLAHTGWPRNKLVSEAEYDAAVVGAYGIEVRERG